MENGIWSVSRLVLSLILHTGVARNEAPTLPARIAYLGYLLRLKRVKIAQSAAGIENELSQLQLDFEHCDNFFRCRS